MKFQVSADALQEIEEAVTFYNDQSSGLGYEFAVEVQKTFSRIKAFPEAWTPFSISSRRCLLDKFPYGELYRLGPKTITVVAVMHLKRHPGKWRRKGRA